MPNRARPVLLVTALLMVAASCVPQPPGATPSPPTAPPTITPSPPPFPTPPPMPGMPWRPVVGQPWQWQLTETVDLSVDVPVYDIDLFDNPSAVIDELHARGRKVICYVSVGTFEPWRPDAAAFPEDIKGKPLSAFPDERWLDIRRLDVIAPIMSARFDLCRTKGFDAIEPDNLDAYQADSGFPLTAQEQITFNRTIAMLARARGLSVAMKNDVEQIPQLINDFDFAINESCFQFDECDSLRPFIAAGKAVLHVEYQLAPSAFCPRARQLQFSSMRKRVALDAFREPC